jgi:hypothetical protein
VVDVAHLRAKAGECRARAKIEKDSTLRDELLSLADYYDMMANELSAPEMKRVADLRTE